MNSTLRRNWHFWKSKLNSIKWQRRLTWQSLLLVLVLAWLFSVYLPEPILYRLRTGSISLSNSSASTSDGHFLDHEYTFPPLQAHPKPLRTSEDLEKCGAVVECESEELFVTFHSGRQDTIPPYICINGRVVMSRETNSPRRGLNVIVLEPQTGLVVRRSNFDTYAVKDNTALDIFLSQVTTEQLVIAFTYDDAWTSLSSAIKETLQSLGSSMIKNLNFRGSWFFIGQKGIKGFSPFENLRRSDDGKKWASALSAKFCVPYRLKGLELPRSPSPSNSRVNQRRENFCKKHDGFFELCDDDAFSEALDEPPLLQIHAETQNLSSIPILVIPGFDLNELCATLRSIVTQPGLNASDVLVVYEENFQEVKDLVEVFNFTSRLISSKPTYHEYFAEAIQSVWDAFPSSEYAIIIEEDSVLSPDFLSFLNQLLPVFESEPKLVSISTWNVNGFEHLSSDTGKVYLTEGFPGFGFMLKRSFYTENMKGRMNVCCNRRSWHGWNTSAPTVYTLVPEISRITRKPYISSGPYSFDLAALFQYPRIMNSQMNPVIDQVGQLGPLAYSKSIQSLVALTETLPHLNCTQGGRLRLILPNVLPGLSGFSVRLSKSGITLDSVCSCFGIYCPKNSSFRNYFNGILRLNYEGKSVFIIGN